MEVSGIKRSGRFRRASAEGLSYYAGDIHGRDVALFVSGIGEERAYKTARAACRSLALKAYISVGLSAALSEGLKPGSLVVAESISSLADSKVFKSDERLLDLARLSLTGQAFFGGVATSRTVLTTAGSKKEAAVSSWALALDMETYGAARAVAGEGVPFLAVRAISDALGEELPVDFNRFIADGTLDWPRFLLHIVTHPGTIPGLIRLGKNSRLGAVNLAGAVERLLLKDD